MIAALITICIALTASATTISMVSIKAIRQAYQDGYAQAMQDVTLAPEELEEFLQAQGVERAEYGMSVH